MASPRKIRLGVSMIGMGYHLAAWRHPRASPGGNMELQHAVRVTQAAERGLLDMAFLADGVGIRFHDEPKGALSAGPAKNVQFEPLTLLSALAMVTNRTSASSRPRRRPTTSPITSRGNSPRSTISAAGGPAGTS